MSLVMIERLSRNISQRTLNINAMVLHKTESKSCEGTLSWFLDKSSGVSAHYVIDYDGTIYVCGFDQTVTWHAGRSVLHGVGEVNQFSLGIEIVGLSSEEMPDDQLGALIELCSMKVHEYKIPLNRLVGHMHIATPPGRKTDPGLLFPWYDFLNTVGARVSEMEVADLSRQTTTKDDSG